MKYEFVGSPQFPTPFIPRPDPFFPSTPFFPHFFHFFSTPFFFDPFSVQELRTVIESAPMSGERLFRAQAELVPLASVGFEQIRTALEHLADDMVIDITLKTGKE